MARNRVTVTVLEVTKEITGSMPVTQPRGDTLLYYLPGADYEKTNSALLKAGFKLADQVDEVLNELESRERNN